MMETLMQNRNCAHQERVNHGRSDLLTGKRLSYEDSNYPRAISALFDRQSAPELTFIGTRDVLGIRKLAFFCSVQCPGSLIIRTHDLAQSLRQSGSAVISGFQSPAEQECLTILLRGPAPVIICPAKSINSLSIRREWRSALESGRLLLLSAFPEKERRPTARLAIERNRLAAALADRVFVAHATEGSKTLELCQQILGWGKPLFTFDGPANSALRSLGAISLPLADLRERLNQW
jgi:predicted Rossmann fold nucleotide-binding protein DprA/Smf involved in DNA uptake